ncbi:Cell wall-binding protein YocH precursor [compost metagenome]
MIPLGSLVYVQSNTPGIEDYGYAVAVDTGGDIKGNRVDLIVYDSNSSPFWTRFSCKVYIMDYRSIDMYKI